MTWIKRKNGTKSTKLEKPELLQRAIAAGQLKEDDLIAYAPDGPWRPLSSVEGLHFPETLRPSATEWRTYGEDGAERKRRKEDYDLNSCHKDFEKGASFFKWVVLVVIGLYALIVNVACIRAMADRYCSEAVFNMAALVMLVGNLLLYVAYWVQVMFVNFMSAALKYLRKISERKVSK